MDKIDYNLGQINMGGFMKVIFIAHLIEMKVLMFLSSTMFFVVAVLWLYILYLCILSSGWLKSGLKMGQLDGWLKSGSKMGQLGGRWSALLNRWMVEVSAIGCWLQWNDVFLDVDFCWNNLCLMSSKWDVSIRSVWWIII